eukprot:CAMPEP_0204368104 /NCGR_PEP_ID=MMETSP0469-20131031/43945_1 /ASSEMBLY_ACC=CAM_ASM_000384 /TAXON_ID=2969 /ORGANISM="Oxyrrhis marina" /LENGTH=58 /DNA_ID=CAMNT_0051357617 /DNA_START=11 /DNA_END=187 /DNA_ORIENTATION=+
MSKIAARKSNFEGASSGVPGARAVGLADPVTTDTDCPTLLTSSPTVRDWNKITGDSRQ